MSGGAAFPYPYSDLKVFKVNPADMQPSFIETRGVTMDIAVYNDEGVCLFMTNNWAGAVAEPGPRGSVVRSTCRIPGNFLAEGRFLVDVSVPTFNPPITHASEREAVAFQVIDRSQGDGVRGPASIEWIGVVRPVFEWRTEALTPES